MKKPSKPTCSSEYIVLDIEGDDEDEDPKQTLSLSPTANANSSEDDAPEETLSSLPPENTKPEVEAVKESLPTPAPVEISNNSNKSEVEDTKETLPIPPLVSVKPDDKWLCQPSIAQVTHTLHTTPFHHGCNFFVTSQDMYLHAKSIEKRHCFSADYLSVCGSRVTSEMRATLVNWLVEIHVSFT